MKNFFAIISLIIITKVSFAQDIKTNEIDLISFQIGKWLTSEIKKDRKGRSLQYGMEMSWFDTKQTIIKMTIYGVYKNEDRRVFWEGFKNWDPIEKKILYTGFSPDGRSSRGHVKIVNDSVFKTIYRGVTPKNKKIFIEDKVVKLDANLFISETYIYLTNEKESKLVNTDKWIRVKKIAFSEAKNK